MGAWVGMAVSVVYACVYICVDVGVSADGGACACACVSTCFVFSHGVTAVRGGKFQTDVAGTWLQ